MKKVDIVYSGWLMAPNGASTFVRNMKESKDIFTANEISLNVYSKDLYIEKSFDNQEELKKNSGRRMKLISCAKQSGILSLLLWWRLYYYHSKFIVQKYIKENTNSDIVYFHELFTCYCYLLHEKKKDKKKIYLTIHSSGDTWSMLYSIFPKLKNSFYHKFFKHIEEKVLNRVDKVGFVANTPRVTFCKLNSWVDERKTFYVYNGIDDIDVRKEREEKGFRVHMICVGTLCERKNQFGILQALSLLPEEIQKKYTITFVGDGEQREYLEKFARESVLTDIYFVGSTLDVNRYLLKADLFILFSKDEGLPISIIEAMRAGLPVISTNVGGIPEMIKNGINGFLIDADVGQLKTLLYHIYRNNYDFVKIGQLSRELFLENFSKTGMIKNYIELFKNNSG